MRVGKKFKKNASEGKTKPCFVRLEKVRNSATSDSKLIKKVSSSINIEENMRESYLGPIKKRPIANSRSVTPVNIKKGSMNEKTDATIAAGRSRRAIKPNPKYSNDDIVTPRFKLQSVVGEDESGSSHRSRSNGKFFDDSSDTDNFYNKDDSSVAEDFSADDEIFEVEDSGSDFEEPKSPPRRKIGRPRAIPTPVSSQTSPPIRQHSQQYYPQSVAIKKNSSTTSTSSTNFIPKTATTTSISTPTELLGKKRKLNQTDFEKERENIIARNKRLNIALYEANDFKPAAIKPNRSSLVSTTQSNLKKTFSNEMINKKSNISPIQPKKLLPLLPKTSIKSTQQTNMKKTSLSPVMTSKQSPKIITKSQTDKPSTITKHDGNNSKNVKEKNSKDDCEMMPTFTIVNINDIINKKGDVLIHKTQKNEENSLKQNTNETKSSTISSIHANRRKTVHSTILSEKIDPTKLKNPLPRTQLSLSTSSSATTKKPVQKILNHTLLNKKTNNIVNSSKSSSTGTGMKTKLIDKPAPRILNSVVGKKTLPVQPMISKCEDSDDPDSPDDNFSFVDDDNETQQTQNYHQLSSSSSPSSKIVQRSPVVRKRQTTTTKSNSKENIKIPATANNNSDSVGQKATTTTSKTITRKLPPERVVVSRQGNKLIKKITCFETWYVINVPEDKPPKIIRNSFDLPLISLANTLDSIKLPSTSWSYKVNLYQLSSQMLSKNTYALYTGDLSEQCIKEEDRSKYQPQSVMFRRSARERPKTRLPYDRAVVFKNNTFFTNIDGKNVKLLGAPTNISSLEEIEILLELIDDFSLESPFVEQTPSI